VKFDQKEKETYGHGEASQSSKAQPQRQMGSGVGELRVGQCMLEPEIGRGRQGPGEGFYRWRETVEAGMRASDSCWHEGRA
jgi:hypothetical protein